MKKSELKTIIRTIVREEVAMAIREVITELKKPQQPTQPITKKPYSKNKVLNDILNETANDDSDWETMGGTKYTSERMSELVGKSYSDMMNDKPVQNINPNDPVAEFVNKDYREVLKKAEQKTKQKR